MPCVSYYNAMKCVHIKDYTTIIMARKEEDTQSEIETQSD